MKQGGLAWTAAIALAIAIGSAIGSASVARGQSAPCRSAPSEPSFRAPDWGDEYEAVLAPPEAEARARVQRLEAAVLSAQADAAGETLRELAEAHRHLYRASGDRAALQEAIRTYARTIRDHPSHPKMDLILFRLAWGLDEMQQQQRARQVYHRLIRGYPRSPYVAASYVRFGDYYWRQGDLSAARQFYERAATLDAGDASAYARYMAAWCHHRFGDHAQARQSVNTARALLAHAASGTARALAAALERDACTLAR